jgi:hypothetical protein
MIIKRGLLILLTGLFPLLLFGAASAAPAANERDVPAMVRAGIVDSLNLKMGDPLKKVFDFYGKPVRQADEHFKGAPYFNYGSFYVVYYYTDEGKEEDKKIRGFIFSPSAQIWGLELGVSTRSEVEVLLKESKEVLPGLLDFNDGEGTPWLIPKAGENVAWYELGENTVEIYYKDDVVQNIVFRDTSSSSFSNSFSDIKIIQGDEILSLEFLATDAPPFIENDYTLVPIRAVAEALNYTVAWDSTAKIINMAQADKMIEMQIDSLEANINGVQDTMPVAPKIVNSRTYVPLRYVTEFFGQNVVWDELPGQRYIWISPLNLLTQADVNAPYDDNYYVAGDSIYPYYALKDTGKTARGIKLGATYEQVIAAYGDATFIDKDSNGEIIELRYYQAPLPEKGAKAVCCFRFAGNVLKSVAIDPPF